MSDLQTSMETQYGPRACRVSLRHATLVSVATAPTVVAAVVLAAAQVLILATLPWTQASLFGETNPAQWLAIGLLIPIAVISFALYRHHSTQQEEDLRSTRIGPYLLREEIGRGGMGIVYRAEHALMKRQCAIKLISAERAQQSDMQRRFREEARATAQLTHWNTIEVYDYGTSEDGRFYYVMEFLEGVNLHQFVDRFGPMPPQRVIYLLKQLSHALYEAESHGLVHRDIKPSNVFLSRRGESFDVVKLLDFGLVQTNTTASLRRGKAEKKLNGSPAFMCPEQARGIRPDHRGDLYSLGAVAYFLLSGHPPFRDVNPIMQVVAHATDAVPSLSSIGVEVPATLENIVMKCLKKEAQDRFTSARELLLALDLCETVTAWSWKDAEQWWQQHQLADESGGGPVESNPPPRGDKTVSLCTDRTLADTGSPTKMCPADTPTEIGIVFEDV